MSTTPSIAAFWDAAADSFDEQADHGLRDLGCGTGSLSLLLAQSGHRVTAVDLSPNMIDHARRKLTAASLEARLLVADAAAPPPVLSTALSAADGTQTAMKDAFGTLNALKGPFTPQHRTRRHHQPHWSLLCLRSDRRAATGQPVPPQEPNTDHGKRTQADHAQDSRLGAPNKAMADFAAGIGGGRHRRHVDVGGQYVPRRADARRQP